MLVHFVSLPSIRSLGDKKPALTRYKSYQVAENFSYGADAGCTFVPARLKRKKPVGVWQAEYMEKIAHEQKQLATSMHKNA